MRGAGSLRRMHASRSGSGRRPRDPKSIDPRRHGPTAAAAGPSHVVFQVPRPLSLSPMSQPSLRSKSSRYRTGRASRHAAKNRRDWNRTADQYERTHGPGLAAHGGMSWGYFHAAEKRLRLLGDVRGKDILELGCGAARWSIALARCGARPVGVDISPRRLDQARELARQAGVHLTLVEASGEAVPLPDKSFDVVFCDFGAMTFADPFRTVPEAARLLRPGGQLTFSTSSPVHTVYLDPAREQVMSRPQRDYFSLRKVDGGESVEFQLSYGEWIRLFRDNGFVVERLLELPAPRSLRSSYMSPREARWGRKLPLESIWSVRKGNLPAPAKRPAAKRSAVR